MRKAESLAVSAKALHGVLKTVAGVVERRNTVPILSNLLLKANGKALTITGTDLDIYFSAHVDLPAAAKIATTVCARTLATIVSKLGTGDLLLTSEDGKVKLEGGRAVFEMPTLPAEDFPSPPDHQWPARFEMSGAELAGLLEAVRYAVSTEETRYYLNGVYFHLRHGELAAAATDGHRLALKTVPLPEGAASCPA